MNFYTFAATTAALMVMSTTASADIPPSAFTTSGSTITIITSPIIIGPTLIGSIPLPLPTDFSGSNVTMGTVHDGQYGTISDLYQSLFTVPPNAVGGGSIFGYLPSNTAITFSYSFTGLAAGNLQANSDYNYTLGGNTYNGTGSADSQLGSTATGFTNGVASAPLVFATAGLTVTDPGTSHGTVTFTNTSSSFENFESIFTGLLHTSPAAIGSATYAVSSIPLPAAAPMFGALIAGMFGFARSRKRKALAA